jgi:hypothetical protein
VLTEDRLRKIVFSKILFLIKMVNFKNIVSQSKKKMIYKILKDLYVYTIFIILLQQC